MGQTDYCSSSFSIAKSSHDPKQRGRRADSRIQIGTTHLEELKLLYKSSNSSLFLFARKLLYHPYSICLNPSLTSKAPSFWLLEYPFLTDLNSSPTSPAPSFSHHSPPPIICIPFPLFLSFPPPPQSVCLTSPHWRVYRKECFNFFASLGVQRLPVFHNVLLCTRAEQIRDEWVLKLAP